MGSVPSDSPDRYTPTVSAEYAAQIQRWHDRAYREGCAETASETTVSYLGATITVPPEVMPIVPTSHLLGQAVLEQARPSDRVLDMGTGSGVNAVLAATRGADVMAVDINPHSLAATQANATRNGMEQRIEVRHSDVFSAVEGSFDLIIFDPPFRWFRPRDLLETAMSDENYRALTRFFTDARQHLAPQGRMLIFFGTSGDLGYLTHLMTAHGFTADVLARDQLTQDGWTVEYFTFLVT